MVSGPTAVKAVILKRSRTQSLITFIPSRAGLALPLGQLWDVGKKRKKSHGKATAAAHSSGLKLTRHTHILYPPRL